MQHVSMELKKLPSQTYSNFQTYIAQEGIEIMYVDIFSKQIRKN